MLYSSVFVFGTLNLMHNVHVYSISIKSKDSSIVVNVRSPSSAAISPHMRETFYKPTLHPK